MNNIEIVLDYIYKAKKGYCDDCLSSLLNITPRQQINQICNRLERDGDIIREKKICPDCNKDKWINIRR